MSIQCRNKRGFTGALALLASAMLMNGSQAMADVLNPVIGPLLFEENFNTLDATRWNTIEGDGCGIGLCGWGNAELENYHAANLTIENPPFEPGTTALAITAKRETLGNSSFTSGKIDSANKIQVKYGLIEFRMSTPQVGIGLWPAGWMLGTSLASWPSKGELDIMEMGHKASTIAGAGYGGTSVNNFVGSNAIYYSTAACVPGNESCAASTAWQTQSDYAAQTPLINRFVIYRMYWTDTQIRFTIVDNGVEHDMYNAPIPITAESSEFNAPFYFLFNLAVGGNFTDAANPSQVTAPLPGKLYLDYVRVYQLDGKGEVKLGNQVPKETGTYGIFTDNTSTTAKETLGTTADFWIWNTASMTATTTIPAYEGSNVLSLRYTTPNQWFGGGIASRQAHDMSNYTNGSLKFRIKIPANVAFKIAINDTYTNSASVTFPANTTTYGLVRNGDWGQATIPIADIRGINALQSMSQMFSFASVDGALPQAAFDMAIDDIVWDCGGGASCQSVATSSSSSKPATTSSSSSKPATTSSSSSKPATTSSSSSKPATTSSSSSSSAPSTPTLVSGGRPVTASTELQPAANAVDGNAGTRWESAQGVSPSWITVDLGANKTLSQVAIDWEAANAANYVIQGSLDNATWTDLKTVTGGAFGNRTDTYTVGGTYRYVRVYCTLRSTGNQWGYSIFELRVYGTTPTTPVGVLTAVAANASTAVQPAANAIDKNGGTRWESAVNTDPSWIVIDLGAQKNLASIDIDWEAANAANYLVQGANTNTASTTWTQLNSKTGGTFGNRTDTLPISGNYRYVRIYGTARSTGNQWGYSIWEVRVSGN